LAVADVQKELAEHKKRAMRVERTRDYERRERERRWRAYRTY
jgi:hypothetical protein